MAFSCTPRGFSCLSKISVLFIRPETRRYTRSLHRNPLNILTSEEARKSSRKPSLVYHDSISDAANKQVQQTTHKNIRVEHTSLKITKYEQVDDSTVSTKNPRSALSSHLSSNPKKTAITSTTKKVPKSGRMTVYSNGEELEVDIVAEKLVAERTLSSLIQNVKSTKARQASGKILLEGERLISDAMCAGVHAEAIFFSNIKLLTTLPLKSHTSTKLYQVNQAKIQLWSDLITSPGIMGVFDVSNLQNSSFNEDIPLTIICDNVRDPGNMGTLIRCAAAAGCKMLVTTPDCVDVWDSKVLRAASGAHFRTKLSLNVDWDLIAGNFVTQDDTVLLADSCVQEISTTSHLVDGKNTLGSQLSWLEREHSAKAKSVEILVNGNALLRDSSYLDEKNLRIYKNLPLPHCAYDKLNLDAASITLVIGGETHGLSSAAHKLAHDHGGLKVFIPLANEVNSLNAGVAMGILVYEVRRLFLQKKKTTSETQKT
ncbi:rRNA methyltransferase 3, mitochondrial-like [Daphnia carinata]|uniref:rRNA methyltransferase 3, mitochondrial-like n=1 Tax=Daphnia carinata TaxID=120202 RepID=UPI00257D9EDB|nr:rRNA methyltransferase 3, mitochondrial-like [Daphnia carinata]